MSSTTLEKLRCEVLRLPEAERAQWARAPAKSLDLPADCDFADARDGEIVRRLAELDTGTATLIDRDELRKRMRARLGHG